MNKSISQNDSKYEIADIFRKYSVEFHQYNGLTKRQYSTMMAIQNCRTDWYGYHEDKCDSCGHIEREYNSCRDRHCPKCQGISKRRWIEARLSNLIPVPYYHVVFTLPHLLHDLIGHNKKLMYNLLFSCSADTLLTFGHDPKWLGGELGFFGILHTWGQTMWSHPHVHFIVPGGALTDDKHWLEPHYKGKFLFPVHALSKVFRAKFIEALKKLHSLEKLIFSNETKQFTEKIEFEKWLNFLVAKKWVVYCKRPFREAEQVVRYIGRYTHRVAISNSRICGIARNQVSFKYKDYRENRVNWKIMRLDAQEFIRRFLWHVLPTGFHKIRHYGFLANGRRKKSISIIKNLLKLTDSEEIECKTNWQKECPVCGEGLLLPQMISTRFGIFIQSIGLLVRSNQGRFVFDTS